MTAKEIITLGKVKVRTTPSLYSIYQDLFKAEFGFTPICPTCGNPEGHRHWRMFEDKAKGLSVVIPNTITMEKTFQLKDLSKIYTYFFKTENGRLIPKRSKGSKMTEEFAIAYLSTGKKEDIEERAKEFKVLPKIETEKESEGVQAKEATKAELTSIAEEKGYPKDEWKKLKKDELIIYLEAKEIDA